MIRGTSPYPRVQTTIALRDAWAEWLDLLDKKLGWDWYVTLTFANDRKAPEAADKAYRLFIHKLNRAVYGVRYTRRGEGVWWVRATEHHRYRDVIHYHALIGGVFNVRRLTWMDVWSNEMGEGWARIQPYDRRRGARYYLAKYIAKGGEIDLYIPRQRRLRLG